MSVVFYSLFIVLNKVVIIIIIIMYTQTFWCIKIFFSERSQESVTKRNDGETHSVLSFAAVSRETVASHANIYIRVISQMCVGVLHGHCCSLQIGKVPPVSTRWYPAQNSSPLITRARRVQ